MTGRGNLHVTAVGEDMADLSRVARDLAGLGVDIEEENLIKQEYRGPYDAFGPEDDVESHSITDFMNLSGGAEVVELTVTQSAPIAGCTLQEANQQGIIDTEALIISIERDEKMLTPKGDTRVRPDDVVALFSRTGIDDETIAAFGESQDFLLLRDGTCRPETPVGKIHRTSPRKAQCNDGSTPSAGYVSTPT